jgi:hypothetical protein
MSHGGTREWSETSVNCCLGCAHSCVYCYAREIAMRFGGLKRGIDWQMERPMNLEKVRCEERFARRYRGVVMFPTAHDVTPGNRDACLEALRCLLAAGNRVLLVTKPRLEIMPRIVAAHAAALREQLLLGADPPYGRFEVRCSITCIDDRVRRLWEPGAPSVEERIDCMRYLRESSVRTSLSIEPCLQPERVEDLIAAVGRYVSETIWIGMCRNLGRRIAWAFKPRGGLSLEERLELRKAADWLESQQTDEKVLDLYRRVAAHPQVRWKDSIREVVELCGLNAVGKDGQDDGEQSGDDDGQ